MPTANASWLARPHLAERLHAPCCLLVAPAGAGKTVLLVQTASASAVSVVWISVTTEMSLVPTLLDAIDAQQPGACATSRAALAAGVSIGALTVALVHDLAALPQGLRIVLDDYQWLTDPRGNEMVGLLAEHVPAHCQLLVASRREPAWPLARLRMSVRFAELRFWDFDWHRNEVAQLLERRLGLSADETLISAIAQRSGLWIGGIQLLIQPLTQQQSAPYRLTLVQQRTHFLLQYLRDEVCADFDNVQFDALLLAALPDVICDKLLDALMVDCRNRPSGRALIDLLLRYDLFMLPYGTQPDWFTLENTFRRALFDILRTRLSRQQIDVLLARIAVWMIEHEQLELAFATIEQLADRRRATQIIESFIPKLLTHTFSSQQAFLRFYHWIRDLPGEVAQTPGLLVISALFALYAEEETHVGGMLDRATELLAVLRSADDTLIQGYIAALRVILAQREGRFADVHRHSQLALARIPESHHFVRGIVPGNDAAAYALTGQPDAALAVIERALAAPNTSRLSYRGGLLFRLGIACIYIGDLARLAETGRRISALPNPEDRESEWLVWGQYFQGRAAYERDDLDTAHVHFSAALDLPQSVTVRCHLDCMFGLAQIAVARGDHTTAHTFATRATTFAYGFGSTSLIALTTGFARWLAIRDGQAGTGALIEEVVEPTLPTQHWLEIRTLTTIAYFIARATPASLAIARTMCDRAEALVATIHYPWLKVRIALVRVQLDLAEGDEQGARNRLRATLAIAQSLGLVRTLRDANLPAALFAPPAATTPTPAAPHLTEREIEILLLVAAGGRDDEIAAQLVVARTTVKRHLSNIYAKLNVNNRKQALARAYALGLLPA